MILEHRADLGLTETQVQKLTALQEEIRGKLKQDPQMREAFKQMRVAKQNGGDDAKAREAMREVLKEKMGKEREELKEKVEAILTKDQLAKVHDLMPQRPQGQTGARGQPNRGPKKNDGERRRPPAGENAPVPFENKMDENLAF